MKHVILTLAAGLGLALLPLSAADKKPDLSKLPPASTKAGLAFAKDIKPLLETSCLKCHGEQKPKGKYRVTTRENFIKGGEEHSPAVVAGKSADSAVVHMVADLIDDMEMPPKDKREKYPALTKDQIGLLRAWIDQGAK